MVSLACLLVLELAVLRTFALDAQVSADGRITIVQQPHRPIIRQESIADGADAPAGEGHQMASLLADRQDPIPAPDWEPHRDMPVMPDCTTKFSLDVGGSEYGVFDHGCSACEHKCTEDNKQQPIELAWTFEPDLKFCNAFDVKFYLNWVHIDKLNHRDLKDKGLRHKGIFSIATNAGQGSYDNKVLAFDGWMGAEVHGGAHPEGSAFPGVHVFEIYDTEEPVCTKSGKAKRNPEGRWLATPGGIGEFDTFTCTRICKEGHDCEKCGEYFGTRCEAIIAMGSSQLFSYRIYKIGDDVPGTLNGNSYIGTEWMVTADSLTHPSPAFAVGRIILTGNDKVYGIKELRQSHEHIGCVHCDLFYESVVTTGPFIAKPEKVHALTSAQAKPPSAPSCKNFRMSSLSGFAVKFETGPAVYPSSEAEETIFTCIHEDFISNACPIIGVTDKKGKD